MSHVPVGPSTWGLIIAALSAAAAFVVAWAESGSAPAWLAGIAAGLTALLGLLRSWQAVTLAKAGDYAPTSDLLVDEAPVVPDDYPEAAAL
jgi:hypothetical protein